MTVIVAYNYLRFGSILETGYGTEAGEFTTPVVFGLVGLLASPGRGLLVYFPLWVLLIPAARYSRGERRDVLMFALLTVATLLALYSPWHQWEGGVCWGPRFLIPAIPPLMVPIAAVFEQWLPRRRPRLALLVVLGVSTAIAFSGTVVNYFEYANWLQWQVRTDPSFASQGITSAYQLFLLRFDYAPVVANWTFFRWDYYFVIDALRKPGIVLAIYSVFAAGLAVGLLRLRAVLRTA
jgi:hypothetical protein